MSSTPQHLVEADPLASALLALRAKATSAAELRLLELVPASVQARARLAERDAVVRVALGLLPGTPTQAACSLARHLNRYLAGPEWPEDQVRGTTPADAPS